MVTASQVVELALGQEGDRYIFGIEPSPSDSNPSAFDCSELVQWIGSRLSIKPVVPDGSWIQWQHAKKHGTLLTVAQGIATKGALLYSFKGDPAGKARPASAHVAISQGNGRTIEARSTKFGVNQFDAKNRGWTHASLIPGVSYTPEAPVDAALPSDWAVDAWSWAMAGPDPIVRGSHPRAAVTTEQVMVWLKRALDKQP